MTTTNEENCSKTVRFDVGGHVYRVSRSLIELYPDTMLARMVDTKWRQQQQQRSGIKAGDDDDSNGDIMFIDRNGDRFQYVLDYMRDRQVTLPMTVSVSAFRQDLDYFGFDNAKETTSASITVGTPAEAGALFTTLMGNYHFDLDKFEALIKESENQTKSLQQQKCSLKIAHEIFGRLTPHFQAEPHDRHHTTLSFAVRGDASVALHYCDCDGKYLKEYLSHYGLDLVSVSRPPLSVHQPYSVVVKRCTTTGNGDGSLKQSSRIWAQPEVTAAGLSTSNTNEYHVENL
jgi:BTB/POZ domain